MPHPLRFEHPARHSRRIIGWSMKPALARELVLAALLVALWANHGKRVLAHTD